MKDEYSEVKKVNTEGNTAEIGNVKFMYVPEGFKYEIISDTSTHILIEFAKGDQYFMFKISDKKWGDKINTESSVVEEILINNKDTIYFEIDEEKCLSWKELDRPCLLSTNCDKKLLLDIAKGIKINDIVSP